MTKTSELKVHELAAAAASRRGPSLLGILSELGLTVDQELVLLKLRIQLRKLKSSDQGQDQAGAFQFVDGLRAGAVDKQALYLLTDAHAENKRAHQRAELDAFFVVYSLLTTRQKAALATRLEPTTRIERKPRRITERQPSLRAS